MRKHAPIVSTYEYGPVILPPKLDTARTRERLEVAGQRSGLKIFEVRGRQLYARGVVGVIDIGEIIVEILPKTSETAEPHKGTIFLGDLLRFAGIHEAFGLSEASIAVGGAGLLEAIFAWVARSAAAHLREGIPRRYEVSEEISSAIRGRVELRHVVRQRPGRAFELTVRHAPLREDNRVSRILRWLIREVSLRTQSLHTRALCLQLLHSLQHVTEVVPTRDDLERLTLGSMENRWHSLIALARIFIAQGRPNPVRGGHLEAVAVLFTLHDLFEASLRRVLRDGLAQGLSLQRNAGHLLYPTDGRAGVFRLRPDFCIGLSDASSIKIVGDAKWKRIFDSSKQLRLNESDLYQLTAYMAALHAESGFIVCPLMENAPETLRRSTFTISGLARSLDVIGVRLSLLIAGSAEGAALRKRICEAVVAKPQLSPLVA